MEHRERILKIFNGIVPDKIGRGDIMYHPKIVDEALGFDTTNKDYGNALADLMYKDIGKEQFDKEVRFRKKLNLDIVGLFPTFSIKEIEKRQNENVIQDVWGNIIYVRKHQSKIDYVLKTPKDLETYQLPDVKSFGYKNIELWSKNSDYAVFPITDSSLFGIYYNLSGFENYMIWYYTDHDKFVKFMKKYVEFNVELAKECFKHGGDVLWIGDDISSNLGTFMKEEDMRKNFFPLLKWQVKEIKKALNVPISFHSDGDLNEIMEDIIDTGVDGVMALQSFCNMDIKLLKEKYGNRITLWGNIDLGRLLELGTPQMVRQVVKETIKVAAPGGRYILSTDNSPALPSIPTRNIVAMYEAAEDYGNYPIDYDVETDLYRKYIKCWK